MKIYRACPKNLQWIKECKERDGNRCVLSWSTENLEVHHIVPFAKLLRDLKNSPPAYKKVYEERFWDIENWITISKEVHKAYHIKFWRRNLKAGREDWEEFVEEWKLDNTLLYTIRKEEYIMNNFQWEECLPLWITEVN